MKHVNRNHCDALNAKFIKNSKNRSLLLTKLFVDVVQLIKIDSNESIDLDAQGNENPDLRSSFDSSLSFQDFFSFSLSLCVSLCETFENSYEIDVINMP